MVSNQYIRRLSKDTQALRCQNLFNLISMAEDTGDSHWAKITLEIPQRELQKNAGVISITQHYHPEVATHWQSKPRPFAGITTHDKEVSLFDNAMDHLSICFRYSSQLLTDIGPPWQDTLSIGHLGRNLRFPTDTNKWTIKILQEAHFMYQLRSKRNINISVSIRDFEGYWQLFLQWPTTPCGREHWNESAQSTTLFQSCSGHA